MKETILRQDNLMEEGTIFQMFLLWGKCRDSESSISTLQDYRTDLENIFAYLRLCLVRFQRHCWQEVGASKRQKLMENCPCLHLVDI